MILHKIFRKTINGLSSVSFAIPLLVLIAIASILGGLIPQGKNVNLISDTPEWVRDINVYLQLNDIFHSWWYILLLALLILSLLVVTIKRVPAVWRQKGRGAAIGILMAHVGVLLIIGGSIYGGAAGFRYYTRLIEGDVTVMPALPFVIKLERFLLEYHQAETYAKDMQTELSIIKRQDSELSFLRHGNSFLQATAAPGSPIEMQGIKLLPAHTDTGWVFTLVVRDPGGREKVVPVRPWAPELIQLGLTIQYIFAHKVTSSSFDTKQSNMGTMTKPDTVEVFMIENNNAPRSMGFASAAAPLTISGYTISPWNIRPYTGLHVYQRPGNFLLISGIICLVIGLAITLLRGRKFQQQNFT
jgi:hypothetical protein